QRSNSKPNSVRTHSWSSRSGRVSQRWKLIQRLPRVAEKTDRSRMPDDSFSELGAVLTSGKITRFRLLSTSMTSLNVGGHATVEFFAFRGHKIANFGPAWPGSQKKSPTRHLEPVDQRVEKSSNNARS